MAIGNKGAGLESYATTVYDTGHKLVFLKCAHEAVTEAVGKKVLYDGVYPQANAYFESIKSRIESRIPNLDKITFHDHSMGESQSEQTYRRWCLENRLFLNPLNDLGPYSIANRDVLMLPTFATKVSEPPTLVGFFNQLKQEYASARYLLFEATQIEDVHFSDRQVLLYNTLDYPCHSLSVDGLSHGVPIQSCFRGDADR